MFSHILHSSGRPMLVVHGGTSSPRQLDAACKEAAEQGTRHAADPSAIALAVESVAMLEEDGRFNAGSGAVTALDGVTVEMDAAVMDSEDRLGTVAAVRDVRNPVRVAREVANSPHWMLAGEGAQRFARAVGLGEPHRVSPRRPRREAIPGALDLQGIERMWNFPSPFTATHARLRGSDTVGAVVRDARGQFAAASSTGGLANKLLGRVGDTPAVGCGLYAGRHRAFAITGIGERVVRAQLAFRLHEWIGEGATLLQSMERGLALFDAAIDIGIVGVTADAGAVCANRDMAFAMVEP